MKKLFLFGSFSLVLSNISYAQNCKSVKTAIDKFTKKETREGKVTFGKLKMIGASTKWLIIINQEEGNTLIQTSIASLGEFNQSLDESTFFYFLLENGAVVKLANSVEAKPVTQAFASGGAFTVFTTYLLTLRPDKEKLVMLASGLVTDVKVEIPNQKIQSPNVHNKDAKQFRSIIECMQQTAK